MAKQINAIPASEMVVFAPKAPKTISPCSPIPIVAIARSCTAKCSQLNRLGVEVRYVAFRARMGSHGANTLTVCGAPRTVRMP